MVIAEPVIEVIAKAAAGPQCIHVLIRGHNYSRIRCLGQVLMTSPPFFSFIVNHYPDNARACKCRTIRDGQLY
jgi:hypothetical protein